LSGFFAARAPPSDFQATFRQAGSGTFTENTNRPPGFNTRNTSDNSRS
jgi:hypothetical protein